MTGIFKLEGIVAVGARKTAEVYWSLGNLGMYSSIRFQYCPKSHIYERGLDHFVSCLHHHIRKIIEELNSYSNKKVVALGVGGRMRRLRVTGVHLKTDQKCMSGETERELTW